jgi:hypothetical protein
MLILEEGWLKLSIEVGGLKVQTMRDNAWEQFERIFKFRAQTAILYSDVLVSSDKRAISAAPPVGKGTQLFVRPSGEKTSTISTCGLSGCLNE